MSEEISHYVLIKRLGAGGMGEVFLARDTRLEREVALKLLSAELANDSAHRKRFVREARAASSLNHPNVCVIHEVGESADGRPFIAMELIEGRTLAERLDGGAFSIREVIEIAIQAADALEAAHSKGLVHRDVKPANIAVTDRGQVKVLDFGLAKRVERAGAAGAGLDDGTATTMPGLILGTPAYMSPEQALGQELDARSDIFSLGVVIYELVTGRVPFAASSFAELAQKLAQCRFDPMARFNYETPPELDRIARKCLSREPEKRFQSAGELRRDLEDLKRELESAPTSSAAAAPPEDLAASETATFVPAPDGEAATDAPVDNDVLINYSRIDDHPAAAGKQGWVSQFHRNLEFRIAQLAGKAVRIWKQADPPRAAQVEQLLDRVPEVKTFVSVLSPPFVRSSGCRRLVETFWKRAEGAGLLEVNQHPRVLKVVKTPVEANEIPVEIQPLFSRLMPYEFFDRDPASGRVREYDETFGELARQRFHERVYDVAFEVSQVLKHFDAGAAGRKPVGGKTIFLAAATSDLEAQRDQLRRELTELGHEVLPKQPLPLVASELAAVVRSCLERAQLAIHLVGEYYGLVPEATELSIVALQNQVAAQFSGESGLARFIWIPKGLSPRDERQAAFVRAIERDPQTHRGAEVIADTLENFKVLLRARWEREKAEDQAPAKGPQAPPRVYLICDRRDEAAVEPIEDFFYSHGVEVSLPAFDVGEAELQKVHMENLRDCDAALIYYGAGGMHWVDFNVRELQKAAGYREALPISLRAVYVAPPFDRRKERFKSVSAEVIRQPGAAFEAAALERFVADLKAQKASAP
jgi:serine/threonine protein kinase